VASKIVASKTVASKTGPQPRIQKILCD